MANIIDKIRIFVHIWPVLNTTTESLFALGARIRARRRGLGWTQLEAAARAGISYRTWRRLESQGKASIEDLVRAAFALRCEAELEALFPAPPASSMDELLARQAKAGSTR